MKSPIHFIKKQLNRKNIKEYRQLHLLGYSVLCSLLMNGYRDPKGKQTVHRAVKNRYMARMRRKYKPVIQEYLTNNPDISSLEHTHSNKVWFCWLQGLENAPELVKKCYASIQKHLPADRELVLITENNYQEFMQLPDFIQKLYDSGKMMRALFSDIIRLNLLIQHGGTWLDSTVFMSNGNIPDAIWNADLFLFQFSDSKTFYSTMPGFDDRCLAASSWFINSCTNNEILLLTRYLLYHLLQNNGIEDYFALHYMMQLAFETYPEQWKRIPFVCGRNAFSLSRRLYDPYDTQTWELLKRCTPIHKLSYRLYKDKPCPENSYCQRLLSDMLD